MPVMDGHEFVKQLNQKYKHLIDGCEIIAMSGVSEDIFREEPGNENFNCFLPKPVTKDLILECFK